MLWLILYNWESCYLSFGLIWLWLFVKVLVIIFVIVVFFFYFVEKFGFYLISILLLYDFYKFYVCGILCKWNLRFDDFRLVKFIVCFNENVNWFVIFKVLLDWGISID